MKTTSWVSVAVVCAAVAGAGGQNPTPAPSPREKPTDEAWLPKPGSDPRAKENKFLKDLATDPPSAFPNLDIPETDKKDPTKRAAAFEKMCPRLFGTIVLKIEATDDTLRKLLKARLHQGTLEFQQNYRPGIFISGPGPDSLRYHLCLLDMQSAATELWAEQPKELIPWLEELVIAFKRIEQYTRTRVENGTVRLSDLHTASRLRLKMEAELWKAKNPK